MPEVFSSKKSSANSILPPTSDVKKHHKRTVDEYSEVMSREKCTTNPVTAFVTKPMKTFFAGQAKGEELILLLRKHPITQLTWIFSAFILSILPLLLNKFQLFAFFPSNYLFAAYIGWYLLLLGFVIESFLSWFFNVYIITDERIVDVDFLSLIYRNISSAKIDKVEDVTAETSGALRAIFNFGTVRIQTAAEKTEFEFNDIPQPNKVIALVNDLLLEEEREKIEGRVS